MPACIFAFLLAAGLVALVVAAYLALRWRAEELRAKGERYRRAEDSRQAARGGR